MATWFITGCSTGIGREVARAALERGEQVVLTARRVETIEGLAGAYPDQALALPLDVCDQDACAQAVHAALERFGSIDVLVNNAGHGYRAAVEEGEPERVEELFQTNFFGPARLIQLVLPSMRAQHRGLIVNVTSIGAVRGAMGSGYYGASKAALELLTESLNEEVEPWGIRTLIVEPGAFATAFYGAGLGRTEHELSAYDALAERYRAAYVDPDAPRIGDPAAAGRVLVETILAGDLPHRLLLGSDCVKNARAALTARLAEVDAWASVSAQTDFAQ